MSAWPSQFLGNIARWSLAAALLGINLLGTVHAQTQSVFTNQTPVVADVSGGVRYELGMKFQIARPGQITALLYWKAPSDKGTHLGRLWSSAGTLLASVTFTGETPSGWQQQSLATPLSVQANTIYVVSVNVASHFAVTSGGLASPIVNGV